MTVHELHVILSRNHEKVMGHTVLQQVPLVNCNIEICFERFGHEKNCNEYRKKLPSIS